MDNKKIIIICILLLIVAGAIIVMLNNSSNYERIEITPNGTSIDVPANQTKYRGDMGGIKVWNWKTGVLITYNSNEDSDLIKLTGINLDKINDLIKDKDFENIDGFKCYVIDADDILDNPIIDNVIDADYKGKFYCIVLVNETTHDNIIICCKDKDVALHIAKSVEYKKVY